MKKFCTGCQSHRDLEGGITRHANRTVRWICKLCQERKTESLYSNKSGRVADVAKLMTKLYERAGR